MGDSRKRSWIHAVTLLGTLALLFGATFACERAVLANGGDTEPFVGMRWILGFTAVLVGLLRFGGGLRPGWIVGGGVGALLLFVNSFDDVQAKMVEAFGAEVGGLGIVWVVSLFELVFVVPALAVFGEALFVISHARPPGGAIGLLRLMLTRQPPPLEPARRRLLVSGLWLAALVAGWIAYAEALGI